MQSQPPGGIHDCANKCPICLSAADICDEGLVQLDLIHRKIEQNTQRGEAGTHIIQCDPNAEPAEKLDLRLQVFLVQLAAALCQLQAKLLGREAGLSQYLQHHGVEPFVLQLKDGDIDIYNEIRHHGQHFLGV